MLTESFKDRQPSTFSQLIDVLKDIDEKTQAQILDEMKKILALKKAQSFDADVLPNKISKAELLKICRQVRKEIYESEKAGY